MARLMARLKKKKNMKDSCIMCGALTSGRCSTCAQPTHLSCMFSVKIPFHFREAQCVYCLEGEL